MMLATREEYRRVKSDVEIEDGEESEEEWQDGGERKSSIGGAILLKVSLLGITCGLVLGMLLVYLRSPTQIGGNDGVRVNPVPKSSSPKSETFPPVSQPLSQPLSQPASQPVSPPVTEESPAHASTAAPTAFTGCKADADYLQILNFRNEVPSFKAAPKLYILEAPKALGATTAALTKCLFKLLDVKDTTSSFIDVATIMSGGPGNVVKRDARFRSIMSDIVLLDTLRRHPNRVYDRKKATVIVVNTLPSLSHNMPGGASIANVCPHLGEEGIRDLHEDRVREISSFLKRDADFATQPQKFVFLHTEPIGAPGTEGSFGPELTNSIIRGRSIVLTSSKAFLRNFRGAAKKKSLPPMDLFASSVVIVPLIQSNMQETPIASKPLPFPERYIDVFLRDVFSDINTVRVLKSIKVVLSTSPDFAGTGIAEIYPRRASLGLVNPRIVNEQDMAASKLCLHVQQSENSKQNLYDSLQAGCVPIFMYELDAVHRALSTPGSVLPYNALWDLAFYRTLNWTQLGVWTRGTDCLKQAEFNVVEALSAAPLDQDAWNQAHSLVTHYASLLRFPVNILMPSLKAARIQEESGSPTPPQHDGEYSSEPRPAVQSRDDVVDFQDEMEQDDAEEEAAEAADAREEAVLLEEHEHAVTTSYSGEENGPEIVLPSELQFESAFSTALLAEIQSVALSFHSEGGR